MNLDDMSLGIEGKRPRMAFASEFAYRHRFIGNYLTREIRKVRFETDGTFNSLSVRFSRHPKCESTLVPFSALESDVDFDLDTYRLLSGDNESEYYLDAFQVGVEKAARFKSIPVDILFSLVDRFRRDRFKNVWTHKRKRSKDLGIDIVLKCDLSADAFRLTMTIDKILPEVNLCSGLLLRTKPDEIFFEKEFKDILIDGDSIFVTDFLDRPRFVIDVKAASTGDFRLIP